MPMKNLAGLDDGTRALYVQALKHERHHACSCGTPRADWAVQIGGAIF
jgi:hypothetical protein